MLCDDRKRSRPRRRKRCQGDFPWNTSQHNGPGGQGTAQLIQAGSSAVFCLGAAGRVPLPTRRWGQGGTTAAKGIATPNVLQLNQSQRRSRGQMAAGCKGRAGREQGQHRSDTGQGQDKPRARGASRLTSPACGTSHAPTVRAVHGAPPSPSGVVAAVSCSSRGWRR